jgi:hypothetical protein
LRLAITVWQTSSLFCASFNVMKKILAIILISTSIVFAQEKPLSQAEYVKFLYAANTAVKRQELTEALRKRGISFVVTQGLRGLTKSKGANDVDLLRTLDESNRRRENPTNASLPTEKESKDILEKTRQNTLQAIEEMPDFVAKQLIGRGLGYAGTNNFRSLDQLVVAVSFSSEKGEQYKVLTVNGVAQSTEKTNSFIDNDGTTTSGEFVGDLDRIFRAESKTEFELVDTSVLRGRKAFIFDYRILIENSKNDGVGLKGEQNSSVRIGRKGRIFIDRELNRVLRIEFQATDIPASYEIKKFESFTDYEWTEIGGAKYLLPLQADARFTALNNGQLFQSKNLIRFKNYQKFGSEVKVSDEDIVVDDEKLIKP